MKTEKGVPNGDVQAFDDPISGGQQIIKREHDLDFQTKNDTNITAAPPSPAQNASPTIVLSSRQDAVLNEQSSVTSANLKVVYDVEYKAPY